MTNEPRPIRVDDLTWLNMDRPNNLMAVSGVIWFRNTPERAATEAAVMERIVDRFPVFRCRPTEIDGIWCWEEDANFSIERQVNHLVLGGAGDLPALQHYISTRHAVPLPKDRPQWRFEFISGVHGIDESGPVTVQYCRFHHSLADGIRLIQLLLSLFDSEADAAPRSKIGRPAAEHQSLPTFTQGLAMGSVGNVADLVQGTIRGGIHAARSLRIPNLGLPSIAALSRARDQARPTGVIDAVAGLSSPENRLVNTVASAGKLLVGTRAARTVWSGVPGEAKTLMWVDGIDLKRVKAEAKRARATVNDVLLCAVAGGLGRYLVEQGDSRTTELPWMIPVALLPLADNLPRELGNHFTLVNLSLPIGLDDPETRLREISTRMTRLKYSDEATMMFGLQKIVARAPRTISFNLTNMVANRNVGVLSNVPGPTGPMSLAGEEVAGMVGWVPTSGDQSISACILSYNGQVFIGLTTDDSLIADPGKVAHHIAEELVSVGLRARPALG